jgi:hypothetical protein
MSDSKIVIDLNFDNSRGHFFREIQHQLDIVTLLIAGALSVTKDQAQPMGFHNFSPAHGAELPHEEARNKALEWLNSNFLCDAIEATDQFLGRCLSFCAVIDQAGKGVVNMEALDHLIKVLPLKHHKLHFPAKIATLKNKYGIQPNFSEHVLSLNKIRTCIVHRIGRVSKLDSDDNGHLVAKWMTSQMVLRGLETGTQLILTGSGQGLNEESMLEMHIVEHEKVFQLGEKISLSTYDIYSTIFTLWRFGLACSEAIEQLAIKSGVLVNKPNESIQTPA